jgi:DNA repair photolyase
MRCQYMIHIVKIGETSCKSIINSSGIDGVDYAVNPYIGCSHGCTYCYARFMTRWYHQGEKWGSFVDVKKNALECMKNEAPRKKRGVILFSSVTDAYQPIEKKTELTRNLLQVLRENDLPVEILTKSSLVHRDIDVLGEFTQSEVGLTITSLNDKVGRAFEPGASPIQERLMTLEKFSDAGIPTYAFLGPLLPYLSEERLEELLNELADKVGRVIVDRLNIKAGNWKTIEETVLSYSPDILPEFKEASREGSQYYDDLRGKMIRLLDERAIPYDIVY